MKNRFVFISAIVTAFLLTGCNDKTSVEWYVNHHDDLIAKYTECLLAKSWEDPICQNVRSAKNLEIEKPDVKEGIRLAQRAVMERAKSQPVPDLNTLPK